MATCARVQGCALFQQFSMKSSLRVWQTYYCEGDFNRCERWRHVAAGQPVAPNLLPNGRLLDVPIDQLAPKHFL